MKVFGLKSQYSLIRVEGTSTVVSYGKMDVDTLNAKWDEVYLYHKQHPNVGMQEVKDAIIGDINERTDAKILSGFVWTPEGGEPINVWLSAENQRNFSEAQRMAAANNAILPLTFKLGEEADETPIYHTFETVEELNAFYLSAFAFINQCLQEGWAEKDGIDWAPYEALFPQSENNG